MSPPIGHEARTWWRWLLADPQHGRLPVVLLQNAVARKLAVPDLTTTVVTLTLTGLVADRPGAPAPGAMTRRLVSVGAMFCGAIAGATIVLNSGASAALALAVGLLAAATALAVGRTALTPA